MKLPPIQLSELKREDMRIIATSWPMWKVSENASLVAAMSGEKTGDQRLP